MGFWSCFGCGSEKDEAPDGAARASSPALGAGTEKAKAADTAGAPQTVAAERNPPSGGRAQQAQSPFSTQAPREMAVDTGAPEPPAASQDAPVSPEERFGARHRIDDDKVQQAMRDNPYPISPLEPSSSSLDADQWHDADELLEAEDNVHRHVV